MRRRGRRCIVQILTGACLLLAGTPGYSQSPAFVPPPRTIADITAILDQQKPDPTVVTKLEAAAAANPPAGANRAELAKFYYGRGQARSNLGRVNDAIADVQQAIDFGQGSVSNLQLALMRQFLGFQLDDIGDVRKSLQVFLDIERTTDDSEAEARLANTYRHIVARYAILGDLKQAEAYVEKCDALLQRIHASDAVTGYRRASAESDAASASGKLAEARGAFHDAEMFYRRAEEFRRAAALLPFPTAPPRLQQERAADLHAVAVGRMEARQGRMAEGEADVRRALLNRLRASGKSNLLTAEFVGYLSYVLVEQGRFVEAEKLTRTKLEIQEAFHVDKGAQTYAETLDQLASILMLQGRLPEASNVFARLDDATRSWAPSRREILTVSPEYVLMLYSANKVAEGVTAAEQLVARRTASMGAYHFETGLARGLLAMGLMRADRGADALREFKRAVPIVVAGYRDVQPDEDDVIGAAMRDQRMRIVFESYMTLLARPGSGNDAAQESIRLAEFIRGRTVAKALAESSARIAAHDPVLADLARQEQDFGKQIGALVGVLNNVLALPAGERDANTARDLQNQLDKLRARRVAAERQIERQFPNYANLIDPKPPSVEDIRTTLKPDEALVSFYFGREAGFVWVVSKNGPLAFASIPRSASAIEEAVKQLRKALEPDAETITEIPPFNLDGAYQLYSLLLKPVEAAWRPAKSLIVVTNGALGLLPLSLLPTAPATLDDNAEPLFAGYRKVPWLARTHAVSLVPSAAALVTLRHLPAGSPERHKLVGFGDPYFNAEEAADAAQDASLADHKSEVAEATATRGIPLRRRSVPQTENLNSADLGVLPRLPDTADELRSIARALDADPATVLHLGKDANEHEVETLNLSKFKIVAFATHGLLPGDLNGLTQPALALTAPSVAGVGGDGLLTMSKILSLKLDADWVVLSACNSGAGADVNSEAASGLGRAFFYAGSRAILVTNWSVHSASARELVSDLFRRQAADSKIARAEALREAMVSMIDNKGYKDEDGKMLFAYAHPLFWAPYTIIGDGGINK